MFNRRAAAGTHAHLPRADLGESPLWPTAAIITAATLYTTLPVRFVAGPSAGVFGSIRWIVPALTLLLLAVLLASLPKMGLDRAFGISTRRLHLGRHIASLGVISLLSAANAVSIYFLVHALINGAHVVAAPLLRAALHLWSVNVLVFGLWFWQLDGGGPLARRGIDGCAGDFLFPQQAEPERLGAGWRPTFLDYLYVSFTNAAAFSPTDALPLSRWAKMLMLVQSAISLMLAVMVVARAVNILH